MEEKVLKAQPRELKGKNNNRRLRNEGFVPAVLYSHGESESIQVSQKDLFDLFKGKISESVIFKIEIEGKENDELMAYVKDYQKDGVTGTYIHLDLYKVTKGEKIKTVVPIELVGTPKGVKLGGILKQGDRDVSVICLPRDLPAKFEVNISELDTGDSILVSGIEHDEAIEITSNPLNVIAAVTTPRGASSDEDEDEAEEAEEATEEAGEE